LKQDPLPLLTAYGLAERATRADPARPEAWFNRALIEEILGLRAQSRASWTRALALDDRSGWADEARNHLERLTPGQTEEALWPSERNRLEKAALAGDAATVRAIVDRFRQPVREHLLEDLLPAWGRAVIAGDRVGAERSLTIGRVVGRSLAVLTGDWVAIDALAAIESMGRGADLPKTPAGTIGLAGAGRSPSLDSLARAFAAYGEASARIKARSFADAATLLDRSAADLAAAPALSLEADFLRQRIAYQSDKFDEQRAIGRRLLAATAGGRSPALRGRVLWSLGTTELLFGHPAEGIADYQAAEALFARCGLRQNLASVRNLLAGALDSVGDLQAAWALRLGALRDLAAIGNRSPFRLAVSSAAFAAEEQGEPASAKAFVSEALLVAREEGQPMPIARVFLHRAELTGKAGDLDAGLRALVEARKWTARVPTASDRRSLEVDLLLGEGRLLKERDPRGATERLTEAIDRYQALDYRGLRPLALPARAEAELAAGDDRAAERDLTEAIGLYETEQSSVSDPGTAIGLLDQVRVVYERMIALQVDLRHRPDLALEFAERGRARRLREQLAEVANLPGAPTNAPTGEMSPLPSARQLSATLPQGLVALVYQDLPTRVLIWRVERGGLRLIQVPISRADLEKRIQRARVAAKRDLPEAKERLADLYDLLIRPVGLDP